MAAPFPRGEIYKYFVNLPEHASIFKLIPSPFFIFTKSLISEES